MKLAVIGLGKLGAPLAALLASAGHEVSGADLNRSVVAAVGRGEPPVEETGLPALMEATQGRLTATTDISEASAMADVVFVVVPTPSLPDGVFDVGAVVSAMGKIGEAVRQEPTRRRTVVVTSTVLPGSTNGAIRRNLEESAGIDVGHSLGLCYSPEFIALGSVIDDMRRPDFVLIGESSPWAGDAVAEVLGSITDGTPPIARMAIEEAELVKIAVNTFVTTKISYANMLGELCQRLPGTDATTVAAAVGLDRRIGQLYLRPGAPYGGPCFPRDNAALIALANSLGTTADIAIATDTINRRQVPALTSEITSRVRPGELVAVLGLTYKAGTVVTDESFGLKLATELAQAGIEVTAFDPALQDPAAHIPDGVITASSVEECIRHACLVVIATPWPQFAVVNKVLASSTTAARTVVDYWDTVDSTLAPAGVEVLRPGVMGGH